MNKYTFKSSRVAAFVAATALVVGSAVAIGVPVSQASVNYTMWDTVNVRTGPGTTYATNGTVAGGSVQTFDCYQTGTVIYGDNVWGHLANGRGYVSDYYVNVGGKTLAQVGLPVCGISGSGSGSGWTYSVSDNVNVRSGPSTSDTLVTTLTKGASYTFDCYATGTSVNGDNIWGHLKDGRGYVADWYINVGGKTLAQAGLPVCAISGSVPTPNPTPTPTPTPQPGPGVTASTSQSVTLRVGPNDGYASNGTLAAGSYTFDCYLYGGMVNLTNGVVYANTVWGHLKDGRGYVPDTYIVLGGKTLVQAGAPKCSAVPALPGGYTTNAQGQFVYSQADARWANRPFSTGGCSEPISSGGCGPSAMAMAVTKLTGVLVTPADTTALASAKGLYACGVGAYHSLATQLAPSWGLNTQSVSATKASVEAVLNAGGVVWTCGQGDAPYTSGGHCVAIRGINGAGQWLVFDSKSGRDANAAYAPSTVLAGMASATGVTK